MVSVIVPTYNVAAYLEECISGILGQTYQDFEVIVVDDGSTDATPEIAERFCKQDSRISMVRRLHSNAGDARNAGMDKARGKYLLFFDADDRMPSQMLERLVSRAEQTDADVCCCRSRTFIDGQEGFIEANDGPHVEDFSRVYAGTDFGDLLLSHFVGWPWDKLFRSDFIRAHNLRFQSLSSTNDAYFVYSALALAKRIALVDEALPEHRKHAGSVEQVRWKSPHNVRRAYEALVERLSSEPEWDVIGTSVHLWGLRHMRWNFLTLPPRARGEAFDDYLWCLERLSGLGIALDEEDVRICASVKESLESRADVVAARRSLSMLEAEREWERQQDGFEAEIAGLRYALDHVMGSVSYKVGRAITMAPRKLRDALGHRGKG